MSKTVKVEDLPAYTDDLLRKLFKGKQNGFRRFGEEGVVLPRSYEGHADAIRAVEVRPDDVWLVTYPRSVNLRYASLNLGPTRVQRGSNAGPRYYTPPACGVNIPLQPRPTRARRTRARASCKTLKLHFQHTSNDPRSVCGGLKETIGTTMTCEILWLMMNNMDYEKAAETHMFHRRHFLEFFTFLQEQSQDLDTNPFLRDFPLGYRLAASASSPRLMVTHLPLSLLPPKVLDVAKVVFVARDPRDVAVSWYHLLRLYRCFDYAGDFKQFWQMFMEDSILFTPFFPRLKETWAQRNHPNMLFLFYEDMVKDISGTLEKISSFCGKQYSREELLALGDHLAIDKFRQNQSVQSVLETMPGMKNEGGESFIRKGKSGGWRAHFDDDMREQAESWIHRNLAGTDIPFP